MEREILAAARAIDGLAFAGTGTASDRGRAQPIEALRILAAFGIVLFHVKPEHGSNVGYAGLIIFLFLLSYFESKSSTTSLATLPRKLLVPWAFWFGVFAVVNLIKWERVFTPNQSLLTDLFYGPSPHLWFLPYAFFMIAIIRILKSHIPPKAIGIGCGVLSFVMITTEYAWDMWCFQYANPAPEYLISLIPIASGVSAALTPATGWPLALIGALIGWIEAVHFDLTIGYIYAIGIYGLAFTMILNQTRFAKILNVQHISRYMLGVYLCHPLFITVMNTTGMEAGLLKALCAFILSLSFTWVLSGQPLRYLFQLRSRLVPSTRT